MPLIIQILTTTPFHILYRLNDDEAKKNLTAKGEGEGQKRNSVG